MLPYICGCYYSSVYCVSLVIQKRCYTNAHIVQSYCFFCAKYYRNAVCHVSWRQYCRVSDFCMYPIEAPSKPSWGYTTRIMKWFCVWSQRWLYFLKNKALCRIFWIRSIFRMLLSTWTMPSIFASMHNLGKLCHRTVAADSIIQSIRSNIIPDAEITQRPVYYCVLTAKIRAAGV